MGADLTFPAKLYNYRTKALEHVSDVDAAHAGDYLPSDPAARHKYVYLRGKGYQPGQAVLYVLASLNPGKSASVRRFFDGMPAYQAGSETSKAAAASVQHSAESLQQRVYRWFLEHGPATDEEMIHSLGLETRNGIPRRVELVRKGMVRDTGQKKKGASGRFATIWEVVL
jgi:hypothetical protein